MGFDDRHILLAGASAPGGGSPSGSIIEIVGRILRPYTRGIELAAGSEGRAGLALVVSGEAQLGALGLEHLASAYEGANHFADEPPAGELRVVANISHPAWLAVAARAELHLGDLGEILERRLPLRLRCSEEPLAKLVLEYYGLSAEVLAELGGALLPIEEEGAGDLVDWVSAGEFDVIVDTIYSGYAPGVRHFHQASITAALDFLAVADEPARAAARLGIGEWSNLPAGLVRGLTADVASIGRYPQAIYGVASMPDGFARLVAQSLDENRVLLRQRHLALSYDTLNVGMSYGVPLHVGAKRYYTSMNYPTGEAAEDHDHGEEEGHTHGPGGHVHDHEHHGPDAWTGLGRGGRPTPDHAERDHDEHGHADHDHDHGDHEHDHGAAPAPPWQGGFGQRAAGRG